MYRIGSAFERIKDEEYGFCEETGKLIGTERFEARPVATSAP